MVVHRSLLAIAVAAALLPSSGRAQTAVSSPASSPASSQAQYLEHQRAQQIIQNVEKAYQNGVANYRDGHPAAAKASFDYAVDQMLTSGIDIKNDPDLSAEFDRILDAVNTLEMDALKQGPGLAAPAEPTLVDIANESTFPVDPNVKAEATAELKTTQSDLPLVMNDAVASYINLFSNTKAGRATIILSLTRAGRYKDLIQRVLKEEGVPQDLIYLAVVESGFRPQAVNPHSGAGGMWQFMPFGVYGLAKTGWYDERFDPEKSTHAYARLIKANYNQLGDWYLAMAAYDWGAGAVQRAVQRTGYADFWELYRRNNLPEQTKNYVPTMLAATIMAKNPKQYGLDELTPDPPLMIDTVQTDSSVDFRLISDITGVPVQEIAAINPSLLRGATPPDESYDLHLPAGTKDLFLKEIAAIPEDKRRYWRFHKVSAGDTLEDVARSFHVSASEIAAVNRLDSTSDLSGVAALVIPVAPVSAPSRSQTALYRTRSGDSLVTVADRFDVTVEQLRRWNHLTGSTIAPGRSLHVAEPAYVAPRGKGRRGAAAQGASKGKHAGAASAKATPAKTGTHKKRGD